MVGFRYPGAVYIFENSEAQRVKVGMTSIGVNDVVDRHRDVNDMWLERKVTCQICGKHTVNVGGKVPQHFECFKACPGGNALPFEKDVAIAESYLESMKSRFSKLSGAEKAAVTTKIKSFEKRIEKWRHYTGPVGKWQFRVAFYVEAPTEVELLSHKFLADYLDRAAPFGEVFRCSVSEASGAIEKALNELGLLESARKETQFRVGSQLSRARRWSLD
jgi:hypothetical protein